MAASISNAGGGDVPCPDPSKHSEYSKDTGLQDQASKAALLAVSPEKSDKRGGGISALGSDGKLSAAGAATSLKYAKPQDLPGFPSVGIDSATSGQKAATLANQKQSTFEHWKPDASSSASKAALMAHKDGGKMNLWQPEATKAGSSAASMAMNKDHNLSPQLDYGYTDVGKRNSLLAATKSISGSNMARPESTSTAPELYPGQSKSAYNALNAATVAHKPSTKSPNEADRWGSEAMEASRIKNAHMSRDLFTEHPVIGFEVDEKRHQEALKASAIVMAKQMMEDQKRQSADISSRSDAGDIAARSVHNKHMSQSSIASEDYRSEATKYVNLQEAARKLAAERLAKLDPDGIVAYREHYGYSMAPPSSRHRLSARNRRRTNEDDDDFSSDDEVRASRIRHQMSSFNRDVASVDEKKRQADRDNLMAAAQKRVQARMQDMDEKVFAETGQVSPAMMEEWEAKAKAKAAAESEQRMLTHGKVHIGGGKYMDQSEIDAIAANRLQPTLDEINDTAEKKRARDEEIRLEQERRKLEAEQEKKRQAELKAETKQNERNEKFRIAQEKRAAKDAEKEEKRQKKASKIIIVPKGESPLATAPVAATTIPDEPSVTKEVIDEPKAEEQEVEDDTIEPVPVNKGTEEASSGDLFLPLQETSAETANEPASEGASKAITTTETSNSNPQPIAVSKLKGFFGKLRSNKASASNNPPAAVSTVEATDTGMSGGLISSKTDESGGLYSASEKDVPATDPVSEPDATAEDVSPSISPVEEADKAPEETKASGSNEEFEEARDTFDDKLEPPKSSLAETEGSPARTSSKFHEEVD